MQHTARMIGPDQLAVFDNALHPDLGTTGDTRHVVYRLDTAAMTATVEDSWSLEGAGHTEGSGSVQHLADGHVLLRSDGETVEVLALGLDGLPSAPPSSRPVGEPPKLLP